MSVLETILAPVGLVFLILLAIGALSGKVSAPAPPPVEDLATPYREGLHAAVRMQRVAQDLEQQIYAEAAQHMNSETERSGAQARERP
jgi:hypothetical protein